MFTKKVKINFSLYILILFVFSSCSFLDSLFFGPDQLGIITNIDYGLKNNGTAGFYNVYSNENEEIDIMSKANFLIEDQSIDVDVHNCLTENGNIIWTGNKESETFYSVNNEIQIIDSDQSNNAIPFFFKNELFVIYVDMVGLPETKVYRTSTNEIYILPTDFICKNVKVVNNQLYILGLETATYASFIKISNISELENIDIENITRLCPITGGNGITDCITYNDYILFVGSDFDGSNRTLFIKYKDGLFTKETFGEGNIVKIEIYNSDIYLFIEDSSGLRIYEKKSKTNYIADTEPTAEFLDVVTTNKGIYYMLYNGVDSKLFFFNPISIFTNIFEIEVLLNTTYTNKLIKFIK